MIVTNRGNCQWCIEQPEGRVSGYLVVPAPLDVEGRDVHAEVGLVLREEPLRHLGREDVVELGERLSAEASHGVVEGVVGHGHAGLVEDVAQAELAAVLQWRRKKKRVDDIVQWTLQWTLLNKTPWGI